MPITDTDMEGVEVKAGDKIAFVYGIPPIRVEGVLYEKDNMLRWSIYDCSTFTR